VFAVGSERGVHYYAMQFIEGQSLASLLTDLRRIGRETPRSPPAPPPCPVAAATAVDQDTAPAADQQAAESVSRVRAAGGRRYFLWVANVGRQAALALEHAHRMGVVHRDVKPANLLLDPRGQVWVTDFGLAQIGGDVALTVTGELVGTLRYASPEQALARPGLVDHRTDVYALGATLYELLTLRPIFEGGDRRELLRHIADTEPLPPRSVDRAVPVELETIILKAVAKEPAERYGSAQELAEDLGRFLEDRPILARRPTLGERSARWARRHRAVVLGGVLLLALLAAGLGILAALIAREQWKTREAYEQLRAEQGRTEAALAQARGSYNKAREAVDALARFGEEDPAGPTELTDLRRRLLETALVYYQDFIDERRDDPSSQAALAAARARVVAILGDLAAFEDFGRVMFLAHLIDNPDVRAELKDTRVTHEEAERLERRVHQLYQRLMPSPDALGRLSSSARRQRLEEMTRGVAQVLSEAVRPDQLRRLKQIAWQQRGPRALEEPEVAAALGLTGAQRQRLRALLQEAHVPGTGRGGADDPGKAASTRLQDVLTPAQKERWEALLGEPFAGEVWPGARPGGRGRHHGGR
jgi:hypothetical protein